MEAASSNEFGNLPAAASGLGNGPLSFDLHLPLVMDLDGTLFATDTLHESFVLFLKRRGIAAWKIPYWALAGRAIVKERLAEAVTQEDVASFPVNAELVAFAEQEADRGRRIVLATAADQAIAEKARQRFPFVSQVIASFSGRNLKGPAKAEELIRHFPDGFIYAGDSPADLHVWRKASGAVFAGRSLCLTKKIAAQIEFAAVFRNKVFGFPSLRRALRLHQWAKNALIFVPLILGGKTRDPAAWMHGLAGFLALSLLASATYILNDLWDLADDRLHWSKKNRPLANGDLPIAAGIGLIATGVLASLVLALMMGPRCVAVLALYLAISIAYSFHLKREPIIDVFLLAALFTMRLALGVVVTGVVFSPWLFVFSMFLFLSLSTAKRQTEHGGAWTRKNVR